MYRPWLFDYHKSRNFQKPHKFYEKKKKQTEQAQECVFHVCTTSAPLVWLSVKTEIAENHFFKTFLCLESFPCTLLHHMIVYIHAYTTYCITPAIYNFVFNRRVHNWSWQRKGKLLTVVSNNNLYYCGLHRVKVECQ